MLKYLAFVLALAFSVNASAGEALIPKTMQGMWCGSREDDDILQRMEPFNQEDCDRTVIHARGFRREGLNCTAVKVTMFDQYPWGRKAQKNPWGPAAIIKFKCGSDFLTFEWKPEKDYMYSILGDL
jgi:hypothetical protein